MAAAKVFVDTSGFYAALVRRDSGHAQAKTILAEMRKRGTRACTTDYIIDETATLLKARGLGHLTAHLFAALERGDALQICFVGEERFQESRKLFERRQGQPYSFTDCTSFVVMAEMGCTEALTKDEDFQKAGFKALLRETRRARR